MKNRVIAVISAIIWTVLSFNGYAREYYFQTELFDVWIDETESTCQIQDNGYGMCSGHLNIPSTITHLDREDGKYYTYTVVGINSDAFSHNENITGVSFPSTIQWIGDEAFRDTGLTSITVPSGIKYGSKVFCGCKRLSDVVVSEGLTELNTRMFSSCPSITSVKLPSSLSIIQSSCFEDCTGLENIILPENVDSIGVGAFANTKLREIVFPANCLRLGSCLQDCKALTSIVLPSRLSFMPFGFIRGCSSLSELSVPGSVETIQGGAFYECGSLRKITFEYGAGDLQIIRQNDTNVFYLTPVEEVIMNRNLKDGSKKPFYGLRSLKKVSLGENVLKIPDYFFYGCSALENVDLQSNILTVGEYAFSECSALGELFLDQKKLEIDRWAFLNCRSLKRIGNPDLSSIGNGAFAGCPLLEYIDISKVREIGEGAFSGCTNLKDITLSDELKVINESTFYGCLSMTHLTIPASVDSIGNYALKNSGIKNLVFAPTDASIRLGEIIGVRSFSSNETLERVSIDRPFTYKPLDADYGSSENLFSCCENLRNIEIGNNVTSIPDYFVSVPGPRELTLPESVKRIGISAFTCREMEKFDTGDGVEEIGDCAFEYCKVLRSIIFGKSITRIGSGIFDGCYSNDGGLAEVISYNPVPPVCEDDTFDDFGFIGCAVLKVPLGTSDAYKAATGWSRFFNIEEIDLSDVKNIGAESDDYVIIMTVSGVRVYEGFFSKARVSGGVYLVLGSDGRCCKKYIRNRI